MMDSRSTTSLLAAAAILSAILGFSYGATFSGACEAIKDAPVGCAEWWLSRYQTLIAVAGAIFAAWLGAQPVLRQLRLSSLQTAATLQQVYSTREKLLENEFRPELVALEKLSDELMWYFRTDEEHNSLTHWVWDMNQTVDSIEERLRQHQLKNLDGDNMVIARRGLIDTLEVLSKCMRNYNATVGADDPESSSSDEDMANAQEAELRAATELPNRITEASKAIDKMRTAYAADLQALRSKRQVYDQILATAALSREV
ncbi:hypothetical protein JQ597_04595 [Bradyrhizobium sp. AUGA SZCCT0177]|uniref:hypothetical protein n=1 Tax=Bradyrhizobium sp. AUGA SZCCT0177 TaxID=2807665 RepID=UPI001BA8E8D5|nr:hypothetical protein [Bradyrhizobium sp. AUGA SZCCT0177]MBR1281314.1 hypothetical protein [Bradyrhizobium sp. AUGA SZCCT0177]